MPSRTALGALLACCALALAPGARPAQAVQAAPATCAGVPATIVGTSGDDALVGTPGDDVIVGLDGGDTVDAGPGNDLVCGDAGPDHLTGGVGDDRLYGGSNGLVPQLESPPEPWGDTLVPGPGDDLVDLGANTVLRDDGSNAPDAIDYSASASGVVVDLVAGTATGEGTDAVVLTQPAAGPAVELRGSTLDDLLRGSEGDDLLLGKGGGDRIEGRGGDDLLINDRDTYEYEPAPGEPADDVFDGGEGADTLDSTGGSDVLLGGPGRDVVRKSRGPVVIDGGSGADGLSVRLTSGRHTVSGGAGRDRLQLAVVTTGDRARGVLDHARGRFVVRLARRGPVRAVVTRVERVTMPFDRGRWTYLGTRGDDRVGGGAAYTARGRGGDDLIRGSYDDDVLLGGGGRDRVVGRGGEDRCRAEEVRGCEVVHPENLL